MLKLKCFFAVTTGNQSNCRKASDVLCSSCFYLNETRSYRTDAHVLKEEEEEVLRNFVGAPRLSTHSEMFYWHTVEHRSFVKSSSSSVDCRRDVVTAPRHGLETGRRGEVGKGRGERRQVGEEGGKEGYCKWTARLALPARAAFRPLLDAIGSADDHVD